MGRSYDIQDEIADQLAGLPVQRGVADMMSALHGHKNKSKALRLLAERIPARLTQIEKEDSK